MKTRRAVISCALAGLLSLPALAGRSLDEPAAVRELAKRTAPAVVKAALKAHGLTDRCSAETRRSLELAGMICRLATHAHASRARPIRGPADVDARLEAAEAAFAAAASLASYEPLNPPPGLSEQLFTGHRLACLTVVDAYDVLAAVPKSAAPALRSRVDAALASFPQAAPTSLREAACRCTQESLTLGGAAGASLEELGALQGTLTGRSCFLDQDKVKSERGGPATDFSGEAKALAAESSVEGQLLAYAKTRDVGLSRCRDKDLATGVPKDKARLERCVCGEVGRWAFPKQRDRPDVALSIPVDGERVKVKVVVKANGTLGSCGPLEGEAVR